MTVVETKPARQSRREREAKLKELREALVSNHCAAVHLKLEPGWTDLNGSVWVQVPRQKALELLANIPEHADAPSFSKKIPEIEDAKTYSLYISAPVDPTDRRRDEHQTTALDAGTG